MISFPFHIARQLPVLPTTDGMGSSPIGGLRRWGALDMPGFKLHPLKGDRKGFWAVTVRANWRVIFRFADADALDVDYLDYH